MSFDWRKEYVRRHGPLPDAASLRRRRDVVAIVHVQGPVSAETEQALAAMIDVAAEKLVRLAADDAEPAADERGGVVTEDDRAAWRRLGARKANIPDPVEPVVEAPPPKAADRQLSPSAASHDSAIVALALQGIPPKDIEARIGGVSRSTICTVLKRERRSNPELPRFSRSGAVVGEAATRGGSHHIERPERVHRPRIDDGMTPADDARLAELIRREVRLTAIAPMMGKRYATIVAAMERLQLSRVPA